ncbi:MAG: hypothetical protein DLM56_14910 [Pseudonocardiales bacterium]|nr:MAG: hypothetical protein DLM56_14910 [Pseudonocardiales bacterium]
MINMPWVRSGGDGAPPELQGAGWTATGLADPLAPSGLVTDHARTHGRLDALVAVHAQSSRQDMAAVTTAGLDASFAVNTRATILLVQAAAAVGYVAWCCSRPECTRVRCRRKSLTRRRKRPCRA